MNLTYRIPDRPPTYPARPMNGGPLPSAPPKLGGRWWYEPKLNGWRVLVHTPSSACFNRHGARLSIEDDFAVVLERLANYCPFEWLDCEALERRHNIGRGTLMVLDSIDDAHKFYDERQAMLDDWQGPREGDDVLESDGPYRIGLDEQPLPDSLYRLPRFTAGATRGYALATVWSWMQELNQQWHAEYYEGLVAKRANGLYPRQLADSKREFPDWVKHRFV